MLESKRQKQVSAVLEQELNDIFRRIGINMLNGGMVSIASVKITPDLFEARIYLSFYKIEDTTAALHIIQDRAWEVKKELSARIRHQLRIVPQLSFFIDDTLEYVDKMEKLFQDIKDKEEKK